MKLQTPFIRLPIRFDVLRLQQELSQFSSEDWAAHPLKFKGNSAIRLISANGEENDDIAGEMMITPHLRRCAYVHQVFAAFHSVLTRSRFMRLAPGDIVPPHSDINYHWLSRTRIHIPIVTHPDVCFECDGTEVHMAEGEAWIFDNWRRHSVANNSDITRVHLVIDTAGSPFFWHMVANGQFENFEQTPAELSLLAFDPVFRPVLMTERFSNQPLMPISDISALCKDIINDLELSELPATGETQSIQSSLTALLHAFARNWESLWHMYGDERPGIRYYRCLIGQTRDQLLALPDVVRLRSNGQSARRIFEVQVLNIAIGDKYLVKDNSKAIQVRGKTRDFFDRPVFIVSAPRAGSTLLFETLASASQLQTIGGESHSIFETIDSLNPASIVGPESNRLTQVNVTRGIADRIKASFASALRDREGSYLEIGDLERIRLLDKLPKNSLRIPFLQEIFPDALFVYLYRDPWESISSMMEAWKSGKWVTYPNIIAAQKRWSLLLPPGWKNMLNEPLESICARQWVAANDYIVEDLKATNPDRHITISYRQLSENPHQVISNICDFANIKFDKYMRESLAVGLPLSRYTQTSPSPEKWKANGLEINTTSALFDATWQKVQQFSNDY